MSEFIEVYRNSVQTWECDQMGHLNVQFYVTKATSALASLAVRIGLGPRYERSLGARLIAEDHHIRFLRERRAGVPIAIRGGILAADRERLRVYFEMTDSAGDEIAATFVANVRLRDTATRRPLALPESAVDAAASMRVALPAHAEPRGMRLDEPRAAPTLEEAEGLGMRRTFEGDVVPAQCDTEGFLKTGGYMGMVSDAYPNVFALSGGTTLDSNHGGAALEYRFIYRRTPQCGDVLTLRSAVKDVGDKTYTFCHWLFDAESGDCVATAAVVAITLDLEARRAIPVPESVRAGLENLKIDGLGV